MRFQKLITHFKQVSNNNKKQLSDYLHSSYFNVPTTSIALFDYLNSIHQSIAPIYLTETAIKKAVPILSTSPIQNKAATVLLKRIEDFYVQERVGKNAIYNNFIRLQVLKQNPIFNDYDSIYDQLKLQIAELEDISRYEHELRLEEEHQHYLKIKGDKKNLSSINNVVTKLTTYYAIKKVRYLCELIQRQTWVNISVKYDIDFVLKELEPLNTIENKYIYLWLRVFEMLRYGTIKSDAYIYVSQYLLANSQEHLSVQDKYILNYIIAICIRNINTGNNGAEEYLQWMELKEKHNLLIEYNHLPGSIYLNLIICGFYAKRSINWIRETAQKYRYKLPEEIGEKYYTFAMGVCSYAEARYNEAVIFFGQSYLKGDLILNQIAKRWEFMSRYQYLEGNKILLIKYLDSWRKHLSDLKLAHPAAAEQIKTFIAYANKLLKVNTRKQKEKLLLDLALQPYFSGKEWIVDLLKR